MEEKRQHQRIKFAEPVQFYSKDHFLTGGTLACDLSETGIRINVNEFIPVGKELILNINLGIEEIAECMGLVVWVSKLAYNERYQVGVEFLPTTSSLESKSRIQEFVYLMT